MPRYQFARFSYASGELHFSVRNSSELVLAGHRTPGIKLKAFWDIFLAGLKSATEIVDLQFDGNAPDFISASCNHALYPRLRILSDQSQFTPPHIISFLRFHPTVEQLHLYHKFDISNQTPLPPTGVVLPCLKFYEGPSHIAHLIIPGSKVSEARIWWGFHPDDPSDFDLVLRSLAKSSVPLTTLVCVGHCWKLEFLPFLAKYMTDVERLDFVTGGATVPADVSRFVIVSNRSVPKYFSGIYRGSEARC